jgi:hypothetical protein
VLIVILVLAAFCVAGAFYISYTPTQGTHAMSTATFVSPSPSATVPSTTSTSSGAPAPEPALLPHDFVAQALPTSFSVVCDGVPVISDQPVTNSTRVVERTDYATNTRIVNVAIRDDTISVMNDSLIPWAVLPGSESGGTTSFWAHANDQPRMAFNPIAEYAGDPAGCQLIVDLPGGELTYGFVQVHTPPKGELLSWSEQNSKMPNRVLVAMCKLAIENGQVINNTNDALVWEFTLISSKVSS